VYSVGRHHSICFSLVELLLVYLTVSRHFGILQHEKRESIDPECGKSDRRVMNKS
jgi:hypothetical protein